MRYKRKIDKIKDVTHINNIWYLYLPTNGFISTVEYGYVGMFRSNIAFAYYKWRIIKEKPKDENEVT